MRGLDQKQDDDFLHHVQRLRDQSSQAAGKLGRAGVRSRGERGHALGDRLMKYTEEDARKGGYAAIYLTTDHNGYYGKYGWKRIEDGYELSGRSTRIYMKQLQL